MWRTKLDGERVTTMNIQYVAVSKDGGFIAAGSYYGGVSVWDAKTYEQVVAGEIAGGVNNLAQRRWVLATRHQSGSGPVVRTPLVQPSPLLHSQGQQINSSIGSTVLEWSVPSTDASIAPP